MLKYSLPILISLFTCTQLQAEKTDEQIEAEMKALGIEDEGLGAKDPDLYDLLDYPREWGDEKKVKKYEKEGMTPEEAKAKLAAEKKKRLEDDAKKTSFLTGFPFIGYNAYTGTAYGIIANYSVYFGDKETTKLSAFNAVAVYTSKEQTTFRVMNQYYSNENKLFITGYAMWANTPGDTYGIGGNTPESNAVVENKTFTKINEAVLFKLKKDLYLGGQFTADIRYKVGTEEPGPNAYTEYAYGTTEPYSVYGGGLAFVYDSRDNPNSAYEGAYINTNYQYFGGDYKFTVLSLDARKFIELPDKRNVLGLWFLATFTTGDVPYDSLPANGTDPMLASARGYVSRRYTGEDLIDAEIEYRRNIWKWFGAVVFANVHSVTETNGKFVYYNPGGGGGIRLKLSKEARANLSVDYAWGKQGSHYAYFRLVEAF